MQQFRITWRVALATFLMLAFAGNASAFSWNPVNWFRGESEEAKKEKNRIVATPEEQAAARKIYEEAQAFEAEGRFKKAASLYMQVAKEYARTGSAPRSLFNRAMLYTKSHRFKKAFNTLQTIVVWYPEYEGFDKVVAEQFNIATRIMEGEREYLWGTIPLLRYYPRAIQYFHIVSRNAPYSEYSPLSLMNIAIIANKTGRNAVAIDALDQMINFYPDNELAPDAYFLLAEVFSKIIKGPNYDQGSTREAISYYEDFLILFPDSDKAPLAQEGLNRVKETYAKSKFVIGEYYFRHLKNETAALVLYNETITVAPNSESAKKAQERIDRIKARSVGPVIGS